MRDLNPDLIRLVASRYEELRGLQTAGDATVLLGFSGAMFAAHAMDQGRLGSLAMTMVSIILGAWLVCWAFVLRRRVDRHYPGRFGRVGRKRYVYPQVLLLATAIGWMGMWCTAPGSAWVREPLALAYAIPAVAWPGWIARRDAPFRAHWALVAIAMVVNTLQLPMNESAGQELWETRALLYGGAALLIAGIGDHVLLLRAMPWNPELHDEAGDRA